MFENRIFESALVFNKPCYIKDIIFDSEKKQLDFYLDFKIGSTFFSGKSDCTKKYKVKDTCEKRWRHLNFFEHECYIHCRTPRIDLDNNKTELISSMGRRKFWFYILFEALVLELCTNMHVHCVCKIIKEHDNTIWRMLEKYIDKALEVEDYSTVSKIGIYETIRCKGHNYITVYGS